jgi:hypothetical protein
MIIFMPKTQDGLDKWSWWHLIGGALIAGLFAVIGVRPAYCALIAGLCGILNEVRDLAYANYLATRPIYNRQIMGRPMGAHYTWSWFAKKVFWMADSRGASVADILITAGGGFICGLLVYSFYYLHLPW